MEWDHWNAACLLTSYHEEGIDAVKQMYTQIYVQNRNSIDRTIEKIAPIQSWAAFVCWTLGHKKRGANALMSGTRWEYMASLSAVSFVHNVNESIFD